MTVAHSGRWAGGVWKLAPCLIAMEAEADLIAPRRRRTSDGSIGDHAHAVRRSDHNPDEEGVTDWVDALDISHDPAGGMDIHAHARTIAARRDPRIDYIISNRRIWSRTNPTWRPYNGSNPHTLHAHFSVVDALRGDTSPWFNAVPPFPTAPPAPAPPPVPPTRVPAEEDDMGQWFRINDQGRKPHHGKVFHVYGREFVHLNGEEWAADQLFHGAVAKEVTSEQFLSYVARRGLTDGRKP